MERDRDGGRKEKKEIQPVTQCFLKNGVQIEMPGIPLAEGPVAFAVINDPILVAMKSMILICAISLLLIC